VDDPDQADWFSNLRAEILDHIQRGKGYVTAGQPVPDAEFDAYIMKEFGLVYPGREK
jgi:hypothetical protein